MFFHGSPIENLTELRAGSYVTPDRETAEQMGRFHEATGQTWSDDDLALPHQFGTVPQFKRGQEPTGKPALYRVLVTPDQLDLLDNPYEHRLRTRAAVERIE